VHYSKVSGATSGSGQTEKSRKRDGMAGVPSTADIFADCRHGG